MHHFDSHPRPGVLLFGLLLSLAVAEAPSSGQSVSANIESMSLATRARLALVDDQALRPYPITVAAEGSALVLTGKVGTGEQSTRAALLVGRIPGVRGVRNELQIADGSVPESYDLIPLDELEAEEIEALDPMMAMEWDSPSADDSAGAEAEAVPQVVPTPEPTVVYKIPEGYHLVEPGESLLRISEKYSLSIRELRELNNLSITDRPEPGQLLRIRPLGANGR